MTNRIQHPIVAHEFCLDLWRRATGRWACQSYPYPQPTNYPPLSKMRQTEWNDEFEEAMLAQCKELLCWEADPVATWSRLQVPAAKFFTLMKNRLLQGSFRYQRLGQKVDAAYLRLPDICRRIVRYDYIGNLELLVDAANLLLCEFVEGSPTTRQAIKSFSCPHLFHTTMMVNIQRQ